MKALSKFHFVSILLIFVLTAAVVSPALAGQPEFSDEVIDYTGPLDNPCGFEITVHAYGVLRWQLFFDKDGVLTNLHLIYGQMKENWSAHGKSLDLQVNGPIIYNIVSDTVVTESYKGTSEVITIPGYGKIFGAAGNTTYMYDYSVEPWVLLEVIKVTGNNEWDWDPVCEYLAP